MALISGRDSMARVRDALGLTGLSVDRLVIVCDARDVTRVYVRRAWGTFLAIVPTWTASPAKLVGDIIDDMP